MNGVWARAPRYILCHALYETRRGSGTTRVSARFAAECPRAVVLPTTARRTTGEAHRSTRIAIAMAAAAARADAHRIADMGPLRSAKRPRRGAPIPVALCAATAMPSAEIPNRRSVRRWTAGNVHTTLTPSARTTSPGRSRPTEAQYGHRSWRFVGSSSFPSQRGVASVCSLN